MNHPIVDILGDPSKFLKQILENLYHDRIDVNSFILDHICYRVTTYEEYEATKFRLCTIGKVLSEKKINGRPILAIELDEPIIYDRHSIKVVELPAPKHGKVYPCGFEHIEFATNMELNTFIQKHDALPWDTRHINKIINGDVRLQYKIGSVKFHFYTLKYVITHLE